MLGRKSRISSIRRLRALKDRAQVHSGLTDYVDVAWAEEFNSLVPTINRFAKKHDNIYELGFTADHDHLGNPVEVEESPERFRILIDRSLAALDAPTRDLSDFRAALLEEFGKSFVIISKKWAAVVAAAGVIAFVLTILGARALVVQQLNKSSLVAQLEAEAARRVAEIEAMAIHATELLQEAETRKNESIAAQLRLDDQRRSLEETLRLTAQNNR